MIDPTPVETPQQQRYAPCAGTHRDDDPPERVGCAEQEAIGHETDDDADQTEEDGLADRVEPGGGGILLSEVEAHA